ncbi:MAG: hypothetical protein ACU0B7_10820 [Paracoccaceae bacterium]|uniref:hypothetical protein n=1 Tax=Seohaeicola saemankumensis TaxID=481181 RepID=UPI001E65C9D5|nr:hypothetical protein [Seohaeicola saemankumensis]MCD1624754.1 hypothetical protein [Seohaeicola saemankumensis]
MNKLIAIINVVAWSGFWAFGYLALTARDLSTEQITIASFLAGLGFVTGMIAYLKLSHEAPALRHMSKIREEG